MADYADREHYIPLRKGDLIEWLCRDARLQATEREPFRQFCRLVSSIWHFEYLETLEKLKDGYATFDPDSPYKPLEPIPEENKPQLQTRFFDEFIQLMERANYKRLSKEDIQAAVEGGASDWGINMHVNWDVFEQLEIFARGDGTTLRTKYGTILFWRKTEKQVETYRRLALLVKLRSHKLIPNQIDTEAIFLKVFKDIPKLDLEMVLPGTRLQMPVLQQSKMGVSLVGTLGYGLYKVGYEIWSAFLSLIKFTTEAATSALGVLWGPFILLGGYGYKQYYSYQVTKQTYSKMLTESLYFQNLDNNAGVITHIVDEAEEQECRETLLAYFYLWKYAPPEGWLPGQLDDFVEMELEGKLKLKVDFEIGDALEKLEKLKIVHKSGERYSATPLDQALTALDSRWDNYFQYAN